jgi:hypothetical protein
MHCVSGKRMFLTEQLAVDALIEAYIRYNHSSRQQGAIAVYRCDDCGQYHLTSRGPMNEKLQAAISDGTIKRQQEANYWLDKFKGL